MKMNELTDREREFLDKVNKINQKYCPDASQSLWNVCRGYLKGLFDDNLLNNTDEEIEATLKSVNEKGTKVTKISSFEKSNFVYKALEMKKEKVVNKPLF